MRRVLLGRRDELIDAPQRFVVEGHAIVMIPLPDEFVALDDTCSHGTASLAEEGEVDLEARERECCRHGARISLGDGSVTSLPATTGLRAYRVKTEGDEIFIELTP